MQNTSNRTDTLLTELNEDGIFRLTLNDMRRRNALSEAMMEQITTALVEATTNKSIRVVIMAANGSAFCAGHDLKEITNGRNAPDKGRAYFSQVMAKCSGLMQRIVTCPKPVIAEVNGIATAAGCQLVASCDLAIASNIAKFSTPGVHIGLFCSTPMVALSRNIGNKHAMEMLLTGDMISAARAAEIGLINSVVTPQALRETTLSLAHKIASKSSLTLATGKRAFYEQRELTLSEAYDHTSKVMVENMLDNNAKEGIGAFIEKRAPQWQDD